MFRKSKSGSGRSPGTTRDNVTAGNAGTAGQHFAPTENSFVSNICSGKMNQALDKELEPQWTMSPEMLALQWLNEFSGRVSQALDKNP